MNDKLTVVGLLAISLSLSTLATMSHAMTQSQKADSTKTQIQLTKKKVNLNKANATEIAAAFKGFGDKRANAIVTYRQSHGAYKSLKDLARVKGISKGLINKKLSELQQVFTLID